MQTHFSTNGSSKQHKLYFFQKLYRVNIAEMHKNIKLLENVGHKSLYHNKTYPKYINKERRRGSHNTRWCSGYCNANSIAWFQTVKV